MREVWRKSGRSSRACVQAGVFDVTVSGAGAVRGAVPARSAQSVGGGVTPEDRAAVVAFQEQLDSGSADVAEAAGRFLVDAVDRLGAQGVSVPPVIGEGGRPVALVDRALGWQLAAIIAYHLSLEEGSERIEALIERLISGKPRNTGRRVGGARPKKTVEQHATDLIKAMGERGPQTGTDLDRRLNLPLADRPAVLAEIERRHPGVYRTWRPLEGKGVFYGHWKKVPKGTTGQRINADPGAVAASRFADVLIEAIENRGAQTGHGISQLGILQDIRTQVLAEIERRHPERYKTWPGKGTSVLYGRWDQVPKDTPIWSIQPIGSVGGGAVSAGGVRPGPQEAESSAMGAGRGGGQAVAVVRPGSVGRGSVGPESSRVGSGSSAGGGFPGFGQRFPDLVRRSASVVAGHRGVPSVPGAVASVPGVVRSPGSGVVLPGVGAPRVGSVPPGVGLPSFATGFSPAAMAAWDEGVVLVEGERSLLDAVLASTAPLVYRGWPLEVDFAGDVLNRLGLSVDNPDHVADRFGLTIRVIGPDGRVTVHGRGERDVVIARTSQRWYQATRPARGAGAGAGGHRGGGGYGDPRGYGGSSTWVLRADPTDVMVPGLRAVVKQIRDPVKKRVLAENLATWSGDPAGPHGDGREPRTDRDPDGIPWRTGSRSAFGPNGEEIPPRHRACVSVAVITRE